MATDGSDTWVIKGYTIYSKHVIGQGAYGIIYKGHNDKGNKIAAKRIDTQRKSSMRDILKDIERLKKLDHPNIVKVYDTHQEGSVVWIFMELCELGDLNKFYRKTELTQHQLFVIMMQIAAGVAFLHENNVVHRDIKPGNILVANHSPIQIKLTDFDVSKFFEEIFETSAMSTDVGTLVFKAPEFFQKTKERKLVYHRNIDVYAAGLTFLALHQGKGGKTQLIPRIETPRHDSEYTSPSIGQLIAERIKYKVKELNIVKTFRPGNERTANLGETTSKVKLLIQKMTCPKPEDRISASHVLKILRSLNKSTADSNKKPRPDDDKQATLKVKRKALNTSTADSSKKLRPDDHKQMTPKGRLEVNKMYIFLSSYLMSIQKCFQKMLWRLFSDRSVYFLCSTKISFNYLINVTN